MFSPEMVPTTIGDYTLERILARGGMALVYLARDEQTGQRVAIKLVHATAAEYYERVRREANILAHLHHEHILPVIEYGEHDAWFYMVTPYIEYGSLRTLLSNGLLSIYEAETILTQLVDAVQYLHQQGLVHRDIKPSNILLLEGRHVYLADFGLAKGVEEGSELTQTGYVIGTPEYMAPELSERLATVSSDIYALGIVLYHMLTGRVPFKSDTPLNTCRKHLYEQPVAPSVYNQAVTPAIDAVILHALNKEPEQRFHSAQALLEAYKAAMANEQQIAINIVTADALSAINTQQIPSVPHRNRSYARKLVNKRVAALLIATIVLLLVVPALLHIVLPHTFGTPQAVVIHASGSIFDNRVQKTTSTLQLTPTVPEVSTIHTTHTANRTTNSNGASGSTGTTSTSKNTDNNSGQAKHGNKGKGKPHKHKRKH